MLGERECHEPGKPPDRCVRPTFGVAVVGGCAVPGLAALARVDVADHPVAVLAATPGAVRERVAGLPDDLLGRRPAPTEWSAAEVLGHLWDSEIAYSFRARAILAQDAPALIGYDQDAWATVARPGFAELLAAFSALRSANVVLVGRTPSADWERVGRHAERGPLTFRLLTETMAGHDRAHLEQLARTIAAVRR